MAPQSIASQAVIVEMELLDTLPDASAPFGEDDCHHGVMSAGHAAVQMHRPMVAGGRQGDMYPGPT